MPAEEIKPSLWNTTVKSKMKFLSQAYMDLINKKGVSKLMSNVQRVINLE